MLPETNLPSMEVSVVDHGAELGSVLDKAARYIAASKAKNTLIAYRGDWKRFAIWCSARGFSTLPAEPQTVALYIADLGGIDKASTIVRALAAIAKAHQAAGFESPCAMRFAAVKEVLDGIRRTHGAAKIGKAALLTDHLRRLIAVVPDRLLGKRDAAILLLGFAGAFRRSELVAFWAVDMEFVEDGIKAHVRRSKTDQEALGRVVGIPYGSNPALCPVRSVRRWLEISGITEGPLFRAIDRHGRMSDHSLTGQVVRNIVERYRAQAGLDVAQFSAHSLRSGFVTQAKINGADDQSIMAQTGHKSPAMIRVYTRDLNLFRDNAATRLGL